MKFLVPEQFETERLCLRQWRDDDWRDLHEYTADPDATAYTYGGPLNESQTWRMMASMVGHWSLRRYGPYALQEKSTSRVIGTVGYWYPIDWPEPEIKWALVRRCWGRGFASEAARAVQQTGSHYLPEIKWISFIHQANHPSIQLAEALGAKWEKTLPFRGDRFHVYRHPECPDRGDKQS